MLLDAALVVAAKQGPLSASPSSTGYNAGLCSADEPREIAERYGEVE